MSVEDETPPAAAGAATDATAAAAMPGAGAPGISPTPVDQALALVDARPEVGAGAALAGGLLLAMILKRLAR